MRVKSRVKPTRESEPNANATVFEHHKLAGCYLECIQVSIPFLPFISDLRVINSLYSPHTGSAANASRVRANDYFSSLTKLNLESCTYRAGTI